MIKEPIYKTYEEADSSWKRRANHEHGGQPNDQTKHAGRDAPNREDVPQLRSKLYIGRTDRSSSSITRSPFREKSWGYHCRFHCRFHFHCPGSPPD